MLRAREGNFWKIAPFVFASGTLGFQEGGVDPALNSVSSCSILGSIVFFFCASPSPCSCCHSFVSVWIEGKLKRISEMNDMKILYMIYFFGFSYINSQKLCSFWLFKLFFLILWWSLYFMFDLLIARPDSENPIVIITLLM